MTNTASTFTIAELRDYILKKKGSCERLRLKSQFVAAANSVSIRLNGVKKFQEQQRQPSYMITTAQKKQITKRYLG